VLISALDRIGTTPCPPADRPRRRLLVLLCIVSIPIGLIWGGFYLLFNEPLAAVFPSLHGLSAIAHLVVFHRTSNEARLRLPLLAQFLMLPFLLMLSLGTFAASSVVVVWSFTAPAASLVLDGSGRALRWFVAYLAVLAIGYGAEPLLRHGNNLPDGLVQVLFLLNIGTLSLVSFGILALFAAQREAALRLAELEGQRSDDLLRNILPGAIADRLKSGNRRIAEQFDEASILFADVVDFTPLSARLAPAEIVDLLDRLFSDFDALVDRAGLEKIKTIGDAYMVAAGVPEPRPDHAVAIARLALEMQAAVAALPGPPLQLRIGINSGPVVAGVIGKRRLIYDLWGDSVNVASRMESQGVPGRTQLTESTYERIRDRFSCEARGTLNVKGRGAVAVWLLVGESAGEPSDPGARSQETAGGPPQRFSLPPSGLPAA
jgi:adenylate cyclase